MSTTVENYRSANRETAKAEFLDYLSADGDLRLMMRQLGLAVSSHKSLKEFVREHGRFFDEPLFVLPNNIIHPESQECYYNAWMYLSGNPGLTYCEGYVYLESCPLPVFHGWCVDAQGNIHDPSINQDENPFHFGLEFKSGFAALQWDRLGSSGLIGILPNWGFLGLSENNMREGLLKPSALRV